MNRCSSCGMEIGRGGVRPISDTERAVYRLQHGRKLAEYCAQCAKWLDSWGEFDGETVVEPDPPARPARRLRISSDTPDRELQEGDTLTEYWFDSRIERSHTGTVVGWLRRERYYQVAKAEATVEKAHARLRSLPNEYYLLYRVITRTLARLGHLRGKPSEPT